MWRHRLKYFLVKLAIAVLTTVLVLAGLRLLPHPKLSDNLFLSTAIYDQNGALLRLTLAKDERYRVYTPLNKISNDLIKGVLLHEDKWFYYHFGFNPVSLIRGGWISYVKKGSKQGGSTITMQLARMYWKLNTRSVGGKFTQILRSIQLEVFYSKDEILEAYMNYAPYGRNIEGIGAASLIYFDKSPDKLTLPEALALAVLPQSPSYRIDKNTGYVSEKLTKARDELFEKWCGVYGTDELTSALFRLPFSLRQPENLPFRAPHFIEQLLKDDFNAGIINTKIDTTLDLKLQTLLETQIHSYINRNSNRGINNAAALLIDTKDMSVAAAVGSADYFNNDIGGQINGFNIKRSPGSALKPFIYALAIEQGLIHPMSVLKDVSTSFSSYSPENFDNRFMGPLSASQALIRSRNIPAVYLNNRLKKPNFYAFLKQAQISKMASESHYGLALALGGGEVTMLEMARLYAMFANGGVMREIRMRKEQSAGDDIELLSKETVFITLDMLSNMPRADSSAAEKQKLPIYWKTGTSWGFRDAWSAGIVGQYVLVVWLGNFDNSGNPAFVGADSAAPLFFNIVNSLQATQKLYDVNKIIPNGVKMVDVCLSSGDLVTVWCKRKGKSWFIPGVSPIKVDTVYRPVLIDKKTNLPVCNGKKSANTKIEIYEYYSSDILDIFKHAGLPKREPPSMEHCKQNFDLNIGINPSITSPLKNTIYTIRKENEAKERIMLSAVTDANVKMLYWFANDEYIGSSEQSKSIFWLPKKSGRFEIRVVDDHGRSDMQNMQAVIIQ
ncbi:MAG: penicillin-binding protein 1C [Campylobacteraceae bacterium]|jgi:penicillin-binding protein 1C|nr:penicillin-binding protein 1C [Campylobacteraceae bacterium]